MTQKTTRTDKQAVISHDTRNTGTGEARLISCIFSGHRAEAFTAETLRQMQENAPDPGLIEERFGVIYL